MKTETAGKKGRRWLRRGLIALVVALLLLALGTAFTVHRYGLHDGAGQADVIVILGAGLEQDGQPTPAMIRRVAHGAALYAAGYAPWLICSGGFTVSVPLSEAAVCADLLAAEGVRRDVVLLEEGSLSTEENAIYTAALMRGQGWTTALITSDDYHLWRATLLFEAQGVTVLTSPSQATTGPISPLEYTWSVAREVAALFWQAFKETLGLPFTRL